MAAITVPIKVDLPENWVEMIVERLKNDPDGEWMPVIRCKDCKNFKRNIPCVGGYYDGCEAWEGRDGCDLEVCEDDFCSRAELKEGAE